MDVSDLESYREQLTQVIDALSLDPNRQDLLDLKAELENLITLTEELVAQQQKSSSSSAANGKPKAPLGSSTSSSAAAVAVANDLSSTGYSSGVAPPVCASFSQSERFKFSAGDECLAKYAGDSKWYPARITSIGGSAVNPVYSIVFKGYNNTEQVSSADIKPTKEALAKRAAPQLTPEEEELQAKKKRKAEKRVEKTQSKNVEAKEKQAAWQKFATKGAKKGYAIPGAKGKSMFATPDDPLSKVGVVGAGRGMTSTTQRTKHIYHEER
ncbi:hypothetical protein K437DRAFT_259225 [Tilletiaria anomala UBC 951]|uniref:Tudor domain-containing protein n=1 Tax=Tilletiaria anomala (strain ATCC 24038 / CBS 436.72 / UBC 951) TaxID=1037660 RepID=A0A066VB22_TILAU|nr:uncharacterized protein K437DRAFT_259225 [Tilletiaria anomala UBC 951]KDN38927.1 hypothetical protein K437DRAFT_259225 [Tilletiaria anomala UBC 951]